MKTIIVVLLAALMSLVSVGCSNSVSPLSVSDDNSDKTAKFIISMAQLGSLGKTAAAVSPDPTFIDLWFFPAVNGKERDTIQLTGSGPVLKNISGFKKGQSYSITCRTGNSSYKYELHIGTASFTVGDVDTFNVPLTLNACASKIKVKIPIKGTPIQTTACSLSVMWTTYYSGPPTSDSSKINFAVGSLDTGVVTGVMPINYRDGSSTDYTVKVAVFLNDGSFYQGSGTVNLYTSANATLTIPLTKFGGGGSLAKMVITINPLGELQVSVTFI